MWSLWQGRYSRWYLLLHHKVAQQVTFLCISDHDHRLPVLTVHLISQVNEYHVLVYRTLAVTPASLASLGLYAFMPVHLSIYIYLYLSIHLSIYLSIYLSVCLSVSVSVSLSVCVCLCLSVRLSACLRPSGCLSILPSVRPSMYVYLSVRNIIVLSPVYHCVSFHQAICPHYFFVSMFIPTQTIAHFSCQLTTHIDILDFA